jgi:hypothetical protein
MANWTRASPNRCCLYRGSEGVHQSHQCGLIEKLVGIPRLRPYPGEVCDAHERQQRDTRVQSRVSVDVWYGYRKLSHQLKPVPVLQAARGCPTGADAWRRAGQLRRVSWPGPAAEP